MKTLPLQRRLGAWALAQQLPGKQCCLLGPRTLCSHPLARGPAVPASQGLPQHNHPGGQWGFLEDHVARPSESPPLWGPACSTDSISLACGRACSGGFCKISLCLRSSGDGYAHTWNRFCGIAFPCTDFLRCFVC